MNSGVSNFGFAGGGGSSSIDYDSGPSYSSGYNSSYDSGSRHSNENLLPGGDAISSILIFIVLAAVCYLVVKKIFDKKSHGHTPNTQNDSKANLSGILLNMDNNSTDQEKWIHEEGEKIFLSYQNDWSNMDSEKIKAYTTARYYGHVCLMLEALKSMNRQNMVDNLKLTKVSLPFSVNEKDELPTKVTVLFKFSGRDKLIDVATGKTLYEDTTYGACENWKFIYDGKTLKLDEISQPTESGSHLVKSIEDFARERQLYYSPDWGRYALPTRGAIFDGAVFRRADINNHIIGKWKDCLFQLYTYSKMPDSPEAYYLVGQLTVPKKYGNIIIKSKIANDSNIKILDGYEEFRMEWEDFNQYYQVFASKGEAVTAFELLDPSFMANLKDRELDYNIEVVGNTIYIFAKINGIQRENYEDLLDVLALAFQKLEF